MKIDIELCIAKTIVGVMAFYIITSTVLCFRYGLQYPVNDLLIYPAILLMRLDTTAWSMLIAGIILGWILIEKRDIAEEDDEILNRIVG